MIRCESCVVCFFVNENFMLNDGNVDVGVFSVGDLFVMWFVRENDFS